MKGSEPLDGISTVLGHDMESDRVSPRLPGSNLMVVKQGDSLTFRRCGSKDEWITADNAVEL